MQAINLDVAIPSTETHFVKAKLSHVLVSAGRLTFNKILYMFSFMPLTADNDAQLRRMLLRRQTHVVKVKASSKDEKRTPFL